MPTFEEPIVNPDFRFKDFLKKRYQGIYTTSKAEDVFKSTGVIRGYGFYVSVPRQSKIGKLFNSLFPKKVAVAFAGQRYDDCFVKLYNPSPELIEEIGDLCEEFENQFPGRKVTIVPVFFNKK